MRIEPTEYRTWRHAFRCTVGRAELVVVTSIGPRILSLRFEGGPNVLFEDDTGFGLNAWRLYGGHRFTVAPESETSYVPDNTQCDTKISDGRLIITQPDNGSGLERKLSIGPAAGAEGFELFHTFRNTGGDPWRGAAWACTCVKPYGQVHVPQARTGSRRHNATDDLPLNENHEINAPAGIITMVSDTNGARFWTLPGADYAGPTHEQWNWMVDSFLIRPPLRRGKVGLLSQQPLLAMIGGDLVFQIGSPAAEPNARYPHGGCNLEVYTCPDYVEMETLGPLTTLQPGQQLVHRQIWQLARPTTDTLSSFHAVTAAHAPAL